MLGFIPLKWTLAAPIEKVILDNEEKSTTYAETGDTGLLIGSVKLPPPKNQHGAAIVFSASAEAKAVIAQGFVDVRVYDGVSEYVLSTSGTTVDWLFHVISGIGSVPSEAYSQKGNANLELRIYLFGPEGAPDDRQYIRNCVLTVVPLYKT